MTVARVQLSVKSPKECNESSILPEEIADRVLPAEIEAAKVANCIISVSHHRNLHRAIIGRDKCCTLDIYQAIRNSDRKSADEIFS